MPLTYCKFEYGIEGERRGAEIDTRNLKYLFSEMGFKVLAYENLKEKETLDMLASAKEVVAGSETVFTVVSSHGYERQGLPDTSIRCSDGGLISDTEVIEFFDHKNMPNLKGVPKVFIFQVCRLVLHFDWRRAWRGVRGTRRSSAACACARSTPTRSSCTPPCQARCPTATPSRARGTCRRCARCSRRMRTTATSTSSSRRWTSCCSTSSASRPPPSTAAASTRSSSCTPDSSSDNKSPSTH